MCCLVCVCKSACIMVVVAREEWRNPRKQAQSIKSGIRKWRTQHSRTLLGDMIPVGR